jgi:23S rRNA (cytidine2498-2'-O)-methyltransferase
MEGSSFLFVCCQSGAERALKNELVLTHPEWRFAYSRPGFVTFKWVRDEPPSDHLQLRSVFARTHGWSLGPLPADRLDKQLERLIEILAGRSFQQLHVWQREPMEPTSGMPQVISPATEEFEAHARSALVEAGLLAGEAGGHRPTSMHQVVADCVMMAPEEWWLGWHRAASFAQRWPGGVPSIAPPDEMVSRAYLKMREAILWSGIPMRAGEQCVELGSSPGGVSQALLEQGLYVTGVDPAEMDARILAHPRFAHVRKRGADVRRREFRGVHWLVADSNVAPSHTLDTVESIVTHPSTSIRGIVLTLKLLDWKLAGELAQYAHRVRSWGFQDVRCRQLASNHQEVCLVALRSRSMRRERPRRGPGQAARR